MFFDAHDETWLEKGFTFLFASSVWTSVVMTILVLLWTVAEVKPDLPPVVWWSIIGLMAFAPVVLLVGLLVDMVYGFRR